MAKGDIVLITFPFTDLSGTKLRLAVVLADTNLTLQSVLLRHKLAGKNRQTFYLLQQQQMDLENNHSYEQVKWQRWTKY